MGYQNPSHCCHASRRLLLVTPTLYSLFPIHLKIESKTLTYSRTSLLINDFLIHVLSPVIYSHSITDSYNSNPNLFFSVDLLSVFSRYDSLNSWRRYLPNLIQYRIAESRLLKAILSFRILLDIYLVRSQVQRPSDDGDESSENRPSPFIQDLRKQTRGDVSITAAETGGQFTLKPVDEAEAELDLLFLLHRFPQTAALAFWLVVSISRDETLLADIKRELADSKVVSVTQPAPLVPGSSILEPPVLRIGHRELMSCSWLRSCFHRVVMDFGDQEKINAFTETECMMFVAGFLALYDVEPLDEGWPSVQEMKGEAGSVVPKIDRLRVRRRDLTAK